jgi:hypothetical protein
MNMLSRNITYTIKLLFLTIVCAIIASCNRNTMNKQENSDFSSLGAEQKFWNGWAINNSESSFCAQPFFVARYEELLRSLNEKLITIAKDSDIFGLVICINIDNGILEVVSLAKGKDWQVLKWKMEDSVMKESIEHLIVQEDILKNLSRYAIFVDTSDWQTRDADSVYVFLRYNGKCSRFAIYNPKFHAGIKPSRNTAAESLELFLRSLNMAPDREDPNEKVIQ